MCSWTRKPATAHRTPGQLAGGRGVARSRVAKLDGKVPGGWKAIKPYLRVLPQPNKK